MRIKRRIPRPLPRPEAQMPRMPRRPRKLPPIDWEAVADMPRLPGRPSGPDLDVADMPPRLGPPRMTPIGFPRRPRSAPRQGPSPEMVGEDFVVPEIPADMPALPPFRPNRGAPQRPRWEGQLDPSWQPGGSSDQFDLSQDVMDALMELLRRNYLGGRAY